MSECKGCKALKDCLQFQDFAPSNPTDKLYLSAAQTLTVTCPDGTKSTVQLPAGIIGYVLTFSIGNPPYPNLTLNCTSGTISIPVPDDATQPQLDALINQMLLQCLTQIAINIGCVTGVFYNTQQSVSCTGRQIVGPAGAFPAGVMVDLANNQNLIMLPGIIESSISIADANAKALEVLNEIFSTGNATCSGSL